MKTMLLTTATAVLLALSGCASDDKAGASPPGGASAGGASTGGASDDGHPDLFAKVVKYAECLQQQGLPVKIHPGDGFTMPKNTDPKKIAAAEAACRGVAPPGMYQKPSAEELDRDVKVAQCLRDQGIKVKDPTEDHPQLEIDQQPPANLRQLQDACEKKAG